MGKTLVLGAVIGLGVLLGVGAWWMRRPAPPAPLEEAPLRTRSGRTALFYLDAERKEALAVLQRELRRASSVAAVEQGDRKDDVALLFGVEGSMAVFGAVFGERAERAPTEAAALVDVLARVRRQELVPFVASLFEHPDERVRVKVPLAAQTQADPRLTPLLLRFYEDWEVRHPAQGPHTRERILEAAWHCGGPARTVLMRRALRDPISVVRAFAAQVCGEAPEPLLADEVARLLDDAEADVRWHAAVALTRLRDERGIAVILAALDARAPGTAVEAAELVAELELDRARSVLAEQLPQARGEVWAAMAVAAWRVGVPGILARARERTRGPLEEARSAWPVLAANGDPADREGIAEAIRTADRTLAVAIGHALTFARPRADLELCRELVRQGPRHPALLAEAAIAGGDRLVPWLRDRAAATQSDHMAVVSVSLLGQIATDAAREALLALRPRWRRHVDNQLRILDLQRIRKGIYLR